MQERKFKDRNLFVLPILRRKAHEEHRNLRRRISEPIPKAKLSAPRCRRTTHDPGTEATPECGYNEVILKVVNLNGSFFIEVFG